MSSPRAVNWKGTAVQSFWMARSLEERGDSDVGLVRDAQSLFLSFSLPRSLPDTRSHMLYMCYLNSRWFSRTLQAYQMKEAHLRSSKPSEEGPGAMWLIYDSCDAVLPLPGLTVTHARACTHVLKHACTASLWLSHGVASSLYLKNKQETGVCANNSWLGTVRGVYVGKWDALNTCSSVEMAPLLAKWSHCRFYPCLYFVVSWGMFCSLSFPKGQSPHN